MGPAGLAQPLQDQPPSQQPSITNSRDEKPAGDCPMPTTKSRLNFPEPLRWLSTKLILAPLLSKAFTSAAHDEADCERGARVVLVGDVPPFRVLDCEDVSGFC